MNTKLTYLYDMVTNEYRGTWNAPESPADPGTYMIPDHATLIAPPSTGANQAVVFTAGAWAVVPDFRGQTMHNAFTGATQVITTLGMLPTGWSTTPPPPTLDQAKAIQVGIVNLACQAAITNGFQASINGSIFTVTLSSVDQANALMVATTVQGVMAKAKPWTANAAVNTFDVCIVGGQYYICVTPGTTGATQPVMPTAFEVPVPDGTAQWKLFGMLVGLSTGNIWCDAPTAYSLFEQGANFVTDCRARYTRLKQQILAAPDVATAQAVVW